MRQEHMTSLAAIKRAYARDGAVMLGQFIDEKSFTALRAKLDRMPRKKEYHPLRHSWERAIAKGDEAKELTAFVNRITGKKLRATYYVLAPGDYSLLHDGLALSGAVAALDLTEDWDASWGGYLGVDQTAIPLVKNTLVIIRGPLRWWIKRTSVRAKKRKLLLFS